jgi:tRNA nucleotidyltransferase (CCA-adding enzyme)
MKLLIPKEITDIQAKLRKSGYQAYIVGGCVRDILLKRKPKDWDITTDAKPEKIQEIFPDSVYENRFGTVGVKTGSEDPSLAFVEVTTFRREEHYSDLRHPDKIEFTDTIEEDLKRRDFTINAMALSEKNEIIDPFNGEKDLKNKTIRAVGNPYQRFNEDALRLMRAVRLAAEMGFEIESRTKDAINDKSQLLKNIATERIRDELMKIIMSDEDGPKRGIEMLEGLGLLVNIVPELREGIGVGQNKHHIYTVWEHNLLALNYTAQNNYSFDVRFASLLHDIGKPRVKAGEGPDSTFYNHEIVGARMTQKILSKLNFPKKLIYDVSHLVRWHLFYYNVGEVTEAGVRRFISRVGPEYIEDLLKVREADRIGSGVPKAVPYKLRHLKFMIEKVKRDPISSSMLMVKGDKVMKILGIKPGPKIGWILAILLEDILNDPKKNNEKYLTGRVKELGKFTEKELEEKSTGARAKKEEFESGVEAEMKKKYYVR